MPSGESHLNPKKAVQNGLCRLETNFREATETNFYFFCPVCNENLTEGSSRRYDIL